MVCWSMMRRVRLSFPMEQQPKSQPPGSLGWPVVGESLSFARSPVSFAEERTQKHGCVWKSRIAGHKTVFVNDRPNVLHHMRSPALTHGDSFLSMAEPVLGMGCYMRDGAPATQVRQLLAPALAHTVVWQRWRRVVARSVVSHLKRLRHRCGEPVPLYDTFKAWATDVMLLLLFGWHRNDERAIRFRDLARAQLRGVSSVPASIPKMGWAKAIQARNDMLTMIRSEIQAQLQVVHGSQEEDTASQVVVDEEDEEEHASRVHCLLRDILQRLSDSSEALVPLDQLEGEVLWLCSALIPKALASTLCTFFLRVHDEDAEEDLQSLRVEMCLRDRLHTESELRDRIMSASDGASMPILWASLNETYRIEPAIFMVARGVDANVACGGYAVPQGWKAVLCVHAANRDPQHYPDALTWRPRRWLQGGMSPCDVLGSAEKPWACPADLGAGGAAASPSKASGDEGRTDQPPPSPLTFGQGDRHCLGKPLVGLLLSSFVVGFMSAFDCALVPQQDVTYKYLPVAKPLDGLLAHLTWKQGLK